MNNFLIEQGFKAIIQRLENNSFINKNVETNLKNNNSSKAKYITITKLNEFDSLLKEISTIGFCGN